MTRDGVAVLGFVAVVIGTAIPMNRLRRAINRERIDGRRGMRSEVGPVSLDDLQGTNYSPRGRRLLRIYFAIDALLLILFASVIFAAA